MPEPLVVVDGPFLLYRSFFALPDAIKGVDGRSVNALLGATNVLLRVAGDFSPRAIVVCWGAEAAHYRVELYPPYHADRPTPPDARRCSPSSDGTASRRRPSKPMTCSARSPRSRPTPAGRR
jgi:5'-3' exonuclease